MMVPKEEEGAAQYRVNRSLEDGDGRLAVGRREGEEKGGLVRRRGWKRKVRRRGRWGVIGRRKRERRRRGESHGRRDVGGEGGDVRLAVEWRKEEEKEGLVRCRGWKRKDRRRGRGVIGRRNKERRTMG